LFYLFIYLSIYLSDKNGADPADAARLGLLIRDTCPHLRLAGLMTIGSVEASVSDGENPDFKVFCFLFFSLPPTPHPQKINMRLAMSSTVRVNVPNLAQVLNWRSLVKTSLELQSCPLFQIN
jgi:hypothetical protein